MSVSVSAQISSRRCQSDELRARRETSKPRTIPTRPMPTSVTTRSNPFTIPGGRGGVAQIAVDDDDLVAGPPQGDGAVAQRVLTLGALGVLEDLAHRGLPHVEQGGSLEMAGRDFLVRLSVHDGRSLGSCPLFTIGTSWSIAIAM